VSAAVTPDISHPMDSARLHCKRHNHSISQILSLPDVNNCTHIVVVFEDPAEPLYVCRAHALPAPALRHVLRFELVLIVPAHEQDRHDDQDTTLHSILVHHDIGVATIGELKRAEGDVPAHDRDTTSEIGTDMTQWGLYWAKVNSCKSQRPTEYQMN